MADLIERAKQSIDTLIKTAVPALEGAPGSPRFIQTHIGIGYRMLRVESGA